MVRFSIQKKIITRKSLVKRFPTLKKIGTEFRVKRGGRIIRTFSSRAKAVAFIKKKRN